MKNQTNIIPFPKPQPGNGPQPKTAAKVKNSSRNSVGSMGKWNVSLVTTVCSLLAVSLATGTTNSSLFGKSLGKSEMPSLAEDRSIASVEAASELERDAAWEKSVAESLASAEVRDIASVSVGHDASPDETLRYGILERKYTILRDLKRNEVESIILQGSGSEPSMLRNRAEFLGQYGRWMSEKYGSSELTETKSVDAGKVESFMVFDTKHKAFAVARFELDRFQRLLAFHLDPLVATP